MKVHFYRLSLVISAFITLQSSAQTNNNVSGGKKLYLDVHHLGPGKVKFEDVAAAHLKDLAVEGKYGVNFINYWVDEEQGVVYCLSSSPDSSDIRKTHAEAHGLLPDYTVEVVGGEAANFTGNRKFFLDIHQLGAGKVNAAAVADAHKKDLAVQGKHGVNFINYWVDEKSGVVLCLSEAENPESVIETHKEAHGLVPNEIRRIKVGN